MKVDNAVIMAAGTSSRFAPLSFETHKAMIRVKGEVLIERQIRQLMEAGVPEIYIVTGYKAEQFEYLKEKFGVKLLHNAEYLTRNNNGSVRAARGILRNSYLCSADNYFTENPFESEVDGAYYAAEYADGPTKEWVMDEDEEGNICRVTIGGENAWYMLGHTFWDETFTRRFLEILDAEYDRPDTVGKLWESIYMEHLDVLKMKIRRYAPDVIFEFDTLDELREFDSSYQDDTRSLFLRKAAKELEIREREITHIHAVTEGAAAVGFSFDSPAGHFTCLYKDGSLHRAPEA